MKKTSRFGIIILNLTFFVSLPTYGFSQSGGCDPAYVLHAQNAWLVLPTGADDTVNLQCAFDQAVGKRGAIVRLGRGTYHTGQVAVTGFVGSFRGVGIQNTTITSLDRTLRVAPLNFLLAPPTPENGPNPWPSIFAFVGGDITFSDFTFRMTSNAWTTGWTWDGLGITVYELAHAFVVVGPVLPDRSFTEANAAMYRVRIEGVRQEASLLGYSPITGIYFEGFLGAPYGQALPLKGRFEVHDSEFRLVAGGTNLFNLIDSHISITRNQFTNSFEGMDIGGNIVNTTYEYVDNQVMNTDAWGVNLYGPFSSSTIRLNNNTFMTPGMGLFLDDTVAFARDTKCRLIRNHMGTVNGTNIYLGPGTSKCLVVCNAQRDTVQDLGVNNKLIGCEAVQNQPQTKQTVSPVLRH